MIRRLYIDNYRCFSNFELKLQDLPNVMIVGANGVGKSTIGEVLGLFSDIGHGQANINDLVSRDVLRYGAETDRHGGTRNPQAITFELELGDGNHVWVYKLVFAPNGFGYKILSEELLCDGVRKLDRATVALTETTVALAVLADPSGERAIANFAEELRSIVVLRPVPRLMMSELSVDGKPLACDCSNYASWLADLLTSQSDAYPIFKGYLECVMPDVLGVKQMASTHDGAHMVVQFRTDAAGGYFPQRFDLLSDGEKCQFIAAAIIAKNAGTRNLVCFWDEPDNYITTTEVDNLLPALSNSFEKSGQLIVTSHSREAIRTFGENEVIRFVRSDHFHAVQPPASVKTLRERGIIPKDESLDVALVNGKVVRG